MAPPVSASASTSASAPMARDARQATETSSSNIPVEIFYHILENLPQNSLTSVARANTSFNDISEKFIYRRLDLTSVPQAVRCCQTLLKKPTAAQNVRECIVAISGARNAVSELGPLLSAALRTLTGLTSLHLALEGPFVNVLDGCYFPSLTTFSSIVDLSPNWTPMSNFLQRHPTITHICMGGEAPGQTFSLPPSALPALKTFMGSRRLVPTLVPGRPVERITLAWHAPNVELEVGCIVPFLAKSSVPVRSFSCATPGWSSALIRAVAAVLPNLHSLKLHNISTDFHNEAEAYTTITEVLSAFAELRSLELPCQRGFRSMLNANRENAAAKAWNERAQRLSSITFPSTHVWHRQPNGSWAPAGR